MMRKLVFNELSKLKGLEIPFHQGIRVELINRQFRRKLALSPCHSGQSPKGDTCNCEGIGIPLLNGPTEFGPNHPTPAQWTTNSRKFAEEGDLLFCVRGSTTGRMNWADQKYAIGRGIAGIRRKTDLYPQAFIRGLVEYNLPALLFEATGSTFPNVSRDQLSNLNCGLFDEHEPVAIAKVLSSLDDKIELLREQNETLEALAQTIFKRWFVDFNFPDENGNPYKDSGGEMIPSELGEIPKGWEVCEVQTFGQVICGKTPSKGQKAFYGNDVPFLKIPDMHHQTFVVSTEDSLSVLGAESQPKKEIPPFSICISCIATVGLVAITSVATHTNQQINSIVPSSKYQLYYLYMVFHRMTKRLIDLASGGSATLNLNTGNFSRIEIVKPLNSLNESFQKINEPLFLKVLQNQNEIKSLTKLRDTLLPKLMKGEIRISINPQ